MTLTPSHEFEIHLQSLEQEPVKEWRFHPVRRWRLDYAWPELRVGVEVHGAIYTRGRHTRGKGFERDREKMNEAQLLGWRILEVTPGHITSGLALKWVEQLLSKVSEAAARARENQ
jgi:very-short-patch-repair endonuclease